MKFVSVFMQVYERSYEICWQLYEKELLTDTSYLYIYGFVAYHSQIIEYNSHLCYDNSMYSVARLRPGPLYN